MAQWIINLGRKQALGRIAHLLCEIGYRLEYAGAGSRTDYRLTLTQETLSDITGLTAVHVNRMLQRLKREKIVTVHGGRVKVADWDQLARVGDFAPEFLILPEFHKNHRQQNVKSAP